MWVYIFLPVITGISIVLQGGLNRASASHIGLLSAVLLNAVLFMVLAGVLWTLARMGALPLVGEMGAGPFKDMSLWQLWPGVFGFLIVLLTPWAIMHLGAGLTFALIIATQLIVSLIWDSLQTQAWPSATSWLGVVLVLSGAVLLLRSAESLN